MFKKHHRTFTRGFTLIELLVVIAIIGILSSVVLASLNSARAKSRDAVRRSDMHQLQVALELYADVNNGSFPTNNSNYVSNVVIPPARNGDLYGLVPTFIKGLPKDPKYGGGPNDYRYEQYDTGYVLLAFIETANNWCHISNVDDSGGSYQWTLLYPHC